MGGGSLAVGVCLLILILLALLGCQPELSPVDGCGPDGCVTSDTADPDRRDTDLPFPADDPRCGTLEVALDASCGACHGANPIGGAVLTNLLAVVGQPSTQVSLPLIARGDVEASYLVHKLRGTHASVGGYGDVMPPAGAAFAERDLLEAWIADGATCSSASTDGDADVDADADADTDTDADFDTALLEDTGTGPGVVDLCLDVQTVFDATCTSCHGATPAGSLDLRVASSLIGRPAHGAFVPLVDPSGSLSNSYLWRKVQGTHADVGGSGGRMPPVAVLSNSERLAIRDWVAAGGACQAASIDTGIVPPDPEGVPDVPVIRRLNRSEYDNTVRDLLGTELRPARNFPLDDSVNGFDNHGGGLTVSNLHVEMYELAAEALAEDFVARYPIRGVQRYIMGNDPVMVPSTGGVSGSNYMLWTNGTLSTPIEVALEGTYTFTVRAFGQQAGPDPARMRIEVDGVVITTVDVPNDTADGPAPYTVQVPLASGEHTFAARFINDWYVEGEGDRNLLIASFELTGPTSSQDAAFNRYQAGILCDPAVSGTQACFQLLFGEVMPRAFRRPLQAGERDRLVDVLTSLVDDANLPYEEAVVGGLQAVLLSPHFLYRPEIDHNGAGDPTPQRLTDHELASRLSYFLWSSMPDDALLARAAAGDLQDDAILADEVRRMVADPKAVALVDDFAGQWLWTRRIRDGIPDPTRYPHVNADLRAHFEEEARRNLSQFIVGPRPMNELVTTTTIEINPELAAFYGYTGTVTGWQMVDLAAQARYGILTNGGLIAALSNPTSSNPVRRGKWVMGQLLCEEPGDPPPGVVGTFDPNLGNGSLRDRFSAHRADPACASCHDKLDPLGFSLEGYGPAGEHRQIDDLGFPVDTLGELPDGRVFDGPLGLGQTLASDPLYPRCVSEKLFSYALGSALTMGNYPFVLDSLAAFEANGLHFQELVVAVATSDGFRMRGE